MAERSSAPSGAGKKKRNFGDRSRKKQQRASTPEPGRKVWTDESERDASEAESRTDGRAKARTKDGRRTRSAERTPVDDPDSDQDFEIIRSMHKSKEMEEEIKQKTRPRAPVKEEPKVVMQVKEMPPLIVAPPELRKRARHKSQEIVLSKLSTSEEEDGDGKEKKYVPRKARVGALDPERKVRRVRRTEKPVKVEKSDVSEPEEKVSERTQEERVIEPCDAEEAPAPLPPPPEKKPWFFMRWFSRSKSVKDEEKKEKLDKEEKSELKEEERMEKGVEEQIIEEKDMEKESLEEKGTKEKSTEEKSRWLTSQAVHIWKEHIRQHANEYNKIMLLKNRCLSHLLLAMLYCGFGGMLFRFVEGAFESFYKCGVKRVKRDFIDSLWSYSQYMLEEDWKSQARRKLMEFENQLHAAHEAGMTTYSGQKSWSFLNSVVYCLTVITTIGYGHISPSTTTGRAITIIYAVFGIPMFLILLADFGKLFTRGIKFLWAYVRRLYYTGSCKKVRRTAPVQEVMKGVQLVYDFAKNRRPSQWGIDEQQQQQQSNQLRVEPTPGSLPETPGTPNLSNFEIDDEFNLPISVAITILLIYIFFGATMYYTWEEWSFFESFYFVFISMSTIGFGDFVPQNPIYMMASIIYLVFGLALTSMCINVVQEKLTDTFRQASTKIGATIGLRVAEDGTISAPPELADVNPIENIK